MRPGRRWAAAAAIAVAAVLPAAAGAGAITPSRATANVTAFARPHHRLPPNPVLRVAESVLVVVTGFASRTTVSVAVFPTGFSLRVQADQDGVVQLSYTVGAGLSRGRYLMTFQGLPDLEVGQRPGAMVSRRDVRAGDAQTITVTVPRIGLFPFRLNGPAGGSGGSGRSGVGGVSVHRPSADGTGSRLADTGADVVGLLLLAVLAGVLGAAALCLGRRRRS